MIVILPITEGETPNCLPKTLICGRIGPKPVEIIAL